jgi:hypothetical protein
MKKLLIIGLFVALSGYIDFFNLPTGTINFKINQAACTNCDGSCKPEKPSAN